MNCSEFGELLDRFIDGELDADLIAELEKHSSKCEKCRAQKTAAEQLKEFLSHEDDEISVPLPAQAAWRKAVKAEARKRSMGRMYRAVGALAAVCVLTLSITLIRPGQNGDISSNVVGTQTTPVGVEKLAYVEADGVSEAASLDEVAVPAAGGEEKRVVKTDDPETAYVYLTDILAEYNGSLERENEENGVRYVHVRVPGENCEDFLQAVDHIGTPGEDVQPAVDLTSEWVYVCIELTTVGGE